MAEDGGRQKRLPVVVRNSDVVTLPTTADHELVLSGAQEIKRGQFVTAAPAGRAKPGFLLKALSVEETGDETLVETRPASLFEAVPGSRNANRSGNSNPWDRTNLSRPLRQSRSAAMSASSDQLASPTTSIRDSSVSTDRPGQSKDPPAASATDLQTEARAELQHALE